MTRKNMAWHAKIWRGMARGHPEKAFKSSMSLLEYWSQAAQTIAQQGSCSRNQG